MQYLHYIYSVLCYYFDLELCWHNYCTMLNKIRMKLECLVSNPLRKQMFHQVYLQLKIKKHYIKTRKISHKQK